MRIVLMFQTGQGSGPDEPDPKYFPVVLSECC